VPILWRAPGAGHRSSEVSAKPRCRERSADVASESPRGMSGAPMSRAKTDAQTNRPEVSAQRRCRQRRLMAAPRYQRRTGSPNGMPTIAHLWRDKLTVSISERK